MSYASTVSVSHTYTTSDIQTVLRRFKADIVAISQSSGAITEAEALEYAHDVEVLSTYGYLKSVDITLLSSGVEQRACSYTVNTESGELTSNRPGGVLWPRVPSPYLRIVLFHTSDYDSSAEAAMRKRLKINWGTTEADTSHSSLRQSGGRDYASNGWGMQRKDYQA